MRHAWVLLLLALGAVALGNDADVSFGGSPKLLHGKTKVRMMREEIVMDVGKTATKVVCDFWFKNDGPTVALRVGFPDDGNANEGLDSTSKATSNFTYFKSWVDGKRVATDFALGDDSVGWHTKTVRFPKGATVHVKDEYSVRTGIGVAIAGKEEGMCKWCRYVVHTGSSWAGKIGETRIIVRFSKDLFPNGPKPVPYKAVAAYEDGRSLKSMPWPARGTAIWKGLAKPAPVGNSLVFVRTNWKPAEKDDLDIWFDFGSRG